MITHIFLRLRDFFYKLKIVIFEVNDVELESEIKVIFMEKRYKQENSSSFCERKVFITFPRNKLYWKPCIWTNQSIDSGRSKSFRVNFTPYVKKNYREGGFIWNVQETSKIQRETLTW